MAGFNYGKIQGIADKVLQRFNQGVQYIVVTKGAGSPDEPGKPVEAVPVTLPGAVAIGVPSRYVAAGLANAGDLQVTSSVVVGLSPKLGDRVVISGNKYTIVSFEPTPPAGVVIVWKFIVRRGG